MNSYKVPRKDRETIYCFDAEYLLLNGLVESQSLVADAHVSRHAEKQIRSIRNSLLLYETRRIIGEETGLRYVYCILDFSSCSNKEMDAFAALKSFRISIDGHLLSFLPFLKSNSMSREARAYFINEEFEPDLKDAVTFGLGRDTELSRWFAYTGLLATSAVLCHNIHLRMDDIAILPDCKIYDDNEHEYVKERVTALSSVTLNALLDSIIMEMEGQSALSGLTLRNALKSVTEKPIQEQNLERHVTEAREYYDSLDYRRLSMESRDLKNRQMYDKSGKKTFRCLECERLLKEIQEIHEALDDGKMMRDVKEMLQKISGNPDFRSYDDGSITWFHFRIRYVRNAINCYDGEGFISMKFCEEINEALGHADEYHTSFQIRLPFIKGVVHSCDFADYFHKNNQHTIKSIYGFRHGQIITRDMNVDEVKMILTESQFKCLKYLKELSKDDLKEVSAESSVDYYFKKLAIYDYPLAISQEAKSDLNVGKMNYQFLSTLPLSEEITERLVENTKRAIRESLNPEAIIKEMAPAEGGYYETDKKMYEASPEFYCSTTRFARVFREGFRSQKVDAMMGRVDLDCERRYLASDLLGLLNYALRYSKGLYGVEVRSDKLHRNEYYAPYTPEEKKIYDKLSVSEKHEVQAQRRVILLRNPHYSRNEIAILDPFINIHSLREKYFSHLSGIVMVSPTSFIASRLGGADNDGDTVLLIRDPEIVEYVNKELNPVLSVKRNYAKRDYSYYPAIVIPSVSSSLKESPDDVRAVMECFKRTFSNNVGRISNEAFTKTFTNYGSSLHASYDKEKNDEVAFYTILGGLEIDSVKSGRKPVLEFDTKPNEFLRMKDDFKRQKGRRASLNPAHAIGSAELGELLYEEDLPNKHNLYRIVSLMNDFSISSDEEMFRWRTHYNPDVNPSEDASIIKTAAVLEAYRIFAGCMNSSKETALLKEDLTEAGRRLAVIAKENGYPSIAGNVRSLTDALEDELSSAARALETYAEGAVKFHYLTEPKEREAYIRNVLGIKNPGNANLSFLLDFSHRGYLSLYYSLLYASYDERLSEDYLLLVSREFEVYDVSLAKGFRHGIVSMLRKNKEEFLEDLYAVRDYVLNGLKAMNYRHDVGKKIITCFKEYLQTDEGRISFDDLANTVNVSSCDEVFTIFDDLTLDYLKGRRR